MEVSGVVLQKYYENNERAETEVMNNANDPLLALLLLREEDGGKADTQLYRW